MYVLFSENRFNHIFVVAYVSSSEYSMIWMKSPICSYLCYCWRHITDFIIIKPPNNFTVFFTLLIQESVLYLSECMYFNFNDCVKFNWLKYHHSNPDPLLANTKQPTFYPKQSTFYAYSRVEYYPQWWYDTIWSSENWHKQTTTHNIRNLQFFLSYHSTCCILYNHPSAFRGSHTMDIQCTTA